MFTVEEIEETFVAEQKAMRRKVAKQLAIRLAVNVLTGVAIHLAVTALDKKFFADEDDTNED